jgi:aryl-alcohol dehydrogenase-like predicted oxidoreductase
MGVTLIDTTGAYGPEIAERLIGEAQLKLSAEECAEIEAATKT